MLLAHFPEEYLSKVITIQDIGELEQYAGRLRKYLRSKKPERQYVRLMIYIQCPLTRNLQ